MEKNFRDFIIALRQKYSDDDLRVTLLPLTFIGVMVAPVRPETRTVISPVTSPSYVVTTTT